MVAGGAWSGLFVDELGLPEAKIIEITNGYDEADFEDIRMNERANDQFTLCYNGRMQHENRNPCILLKMINEMIEDNLLEEGKIRWVINGMIKEAFAVEMQQMDKYHIVSANGEVNHKDCIRSAIDSDLMVFMGEAGKNGWLNYPGKFYEYLRIGRPVLCMTGRGSFQEKVLQDTGITCGQRPDFIDRSNQKLTLVDHKDYIPEGYLPTFNSNTIEMNLHRIKELSENFILFNDDVFPLLPIDENYYFIDDKVCDEAVENIISTGSFTKGLHEQRYAQVNNMFIINKYFKKREVQAAHPEQWFNEEYEEHLERTKACEYWYDFPGFYDPHLANAMKKSTLSGTCTWQEDEGLLFPAA